MKKIYRGLWLKKLIEAIEADNVALKSSQKRESLEQCNEVGLYGGYVLWRCDSYCY